jgi:hypothetical protein
MLLLCHPHVNLTPDSIDAATTLGSKAVKWFNSTFRHGFTWVLMYVYFYFYFRPRRFPTSHNPGATCILAGPNRYCITR